MSLRSILFASALVLSMTSAEAAVAEPPDDARALVQQTNAKIAATLEQPPSEARTGRLSALLDGLIDWDEIARQATDGTKLTDAQRAEVRGLLRRWLARRYLTTVAHAAEDEIAYAEPRAVSPHEVRVRLELRPKRNRRAPATEIEYVVRREQSTFKVVDILTEGASLARNCHAEFARILAGAEDGYEALLRTLRRADDRSEVSNRE